MKTGVTCPVWNLSSISRVIELHPVHYPVMDRFFLTSATLHWCHMAEPLTKLVFLGPPGSGKGTQAQEFARMLGVPHISTGDMFRDHIARATELGQRVQVLLKSGQLVPDDVTNAMVEERLDQPDARGGFIFDGYPRSLPQAEFLARLAPDVRALLIDLSDDEAIRRIAGRRTCQACAAVYHVDYKPPQAEGVCDMCGGVLEQRNDQTEEVVRDRLAVYHRQTEPVVEYYRSRGALTTIDGRPPIPEVTASLRAALGL